jgi:hypothetical protein
MFARGPPPAAPSLFTMQSMACRARALWDPRPETATVACLIDAGADRNTIDNNTVTPLHRAVRTSCAAAVSGRQWHRCETQEQERFDANAFAIQYTGRGGTGSPEAKAQQREIVCLLELAAIIKLRSLN